MPSHILLSLVQEMRLSAGESHLRTAFWKVNISLISMRNYLIVSSGGKRLSSHCGVTAETDRDKKSSTGKKMFCYSRSDVLGDTWMIGSAKSSGSSLQQKEKPTGLNQTLPRFWGIWIHFSILDPYPDFLEMELVYATVSTCRSVHNINLYICI